MYWYPRIKTIPKAIVFEKLIPYPPNKANPITWNTNFKMMASTVKRIATKWWFKDYNIVDKIVNKEKNNDANRANWK